MARQLRILDTDQKSLPALKKGAERLRVFQEARLGPILEGNDADILASRLDLSARRVRTLYAIYLVSPTAEALAPRSRGRRMGSHLLREEVQKAILKEAKALLTVPVPPSINGAAEEILSKLKDNEAYSFDKRDLPSVRQIRGVIDNQSPIFFKAAKSAQHKTSLEPHYLGISAEAPLDAVQMDHTPINLILVATETGTPIGRAYVTLVMDICTRVILGFYLGYEGESINRCSKAIATAIMPKELLFKSLGIGKKFHFPMRGVFNRFYADWAPAHRSEAFCAALLYAGVDDPYARGRGGPHLGGHVERLIGTMMGKCHFLPGRTGRSAKDRGDFNSQADACLTLREAERWLWNQVAVYHEQPHAGLGGIPPALKWRMETEIHPVNEFKGDPIHFAKLCLPRDERTVRSSGIYLEYQRYAAPILDNHIGLRANLHYDPANAGEVYILVGNHFHTLKCQTKLPFEGISFAELKARRKTLKVQVELYREEEGIEREQRHRVAARGEVDAAKRRQRAQRKREKGASIVDLLITPKSDAKESKSCAFVKVSGLKDRWSIARIPAARRKVDDE